MTAHPIPPDADLVALVELNKRWDIEDACAERKRLRLTKRSASSRQGHQTARSRRMEEHVRVWGEQVHQGERA